MRGSMVHVKRDAKGYQTSWSGYKLHIDAADGAIPVSCLLTSASLHDSQVAIPLATLTAERVCMTFQGIGESSFARYLKRKPCSRFNV